MHSAQPARRNQGAIRTAKNLHFHCQQACARSVQVLRRQSARRVLTAMVQGASYNWQATCIGDMGGSAQVAPSAENNKAPILVVLRRYLPSEVQGTVLEVASGTGQHISHFARALPAVEWQPSDLTAELFPSIAAHSSGLSNVRAPLVLDASWTPDKWCATLAGRGQQQYDAVIVANMTHISPWAATQGLVAGAAAVLKPGGILSIYGPFKLRGAFTTDSNKAFHDRLVASNPAWGYRNTDDIAGLAQAQGLKLVAIEPMPANNFQMIFSAEKQGA